MALELGQQPAVATQRRVSLRSRLFGLGSVFGKTLRDSRRAILFVAGFLTIIWLTAGAAMASTFGTLATRLEATALTSSLPPIILGLYGGTQENVVTLGGFVNWRYGLILLLLPAVWSLLALSGTLVREARNGSMDILAAGTLPRRRIALEKYLAHVIALLLTLVVVTAVSYLVGTAFATLTPEEVAQAGGTGTDQIPLVNAVNGGLFMGLVALAIGSIAFALAPYLGRGGAAGAAGLFLAGSWVVYGYRESIGVFEALTPLSLFAWTGGHRPLAGAYDWPSLLPLVLIIVVGAVIGIASFERRDLGDVGSVRAPGLPRALRGVGRPFSRSWSERLGGAAGWGLGLGLLALAIAASGDQLRDSIMESPSIRRIFELAFPTIDINAPGFGLQLAFLSFGYLGAGLAAATLVSGWASDETDGRLEMVLSTRVPRLRWFVESTLGVLVAIGLFTLIVAAGIALGVTGTGQDPAVPFAGTFVLALYGSAVAGIGFAVAGWIRSGLAVVGALTVAVGTMLIDIIVPALGLPDWVHELALTSHFGQPMLGTWDPVGVAVAAILAIGGIALGALGFARRDLER
jgi:ABC-2 type transport system permease protein